MEVVFPPRPGAVTAVVAQHSGIVAQRVSVAAALAAAAPQQLLRELQAAVAHV